MNTSARTGFLCALLAYVLWGMFPLFFRAIGHIPATELVAHRVIWALPTALIVMALMGRLGEIVPLLKDWRTVKMVLLTAGLISLNWGIYVWAIAQDRTSETALGYYINPLITVILGMAFLSEHLNKWQWGALGIASLAVLLRTVIGGELPWIPLSLAMTFAAYGYFRKTLSIGPTQGFILEVIVLTPFAIAYAIWLAISGHGNFEGDSIAWLIACGPVTAAPLILYAIGAKKLRLVTLGLMQYIAPTIIFLIAIFVFKEELDLWQFVSFCLVWVALVIYTWSSLTAPQLEKS